MTDIAAQLRAIRARLDLTQEALAERLGVSFATINRWEGGLNKPQRAARATIDRLAVEAGVMTDGQGSTEPLEAAALITGRRARRPRDANGSTKSMEQMLWDAACSIRGEKDAAKFKDYLPPSCS